MTKIKRKASGLQISPKICSFEKFRKTASSFKIRGMKSIFLTTILLFAGAASAQGVIRDVAIAVQVPAEVIGRIVIQESGGKPYCLNTNSDLGSFCFKTKSKAHEALQFLLDSGYKSIDVGLAQVNIKYHPDLFESPHDLLDPTKNIIAAGGVIKKIKLSGQTDIHKIVGHYHSPGNKVRAQRYADSVLR